MNIQTSTQASSSNRAIAAAFVACITFVLGYTATRAFLMRPADPTTGVESSVIPHQAEMWKDI